MIPISVYPVFNLSDYLNCEHNLVTTASFYSEYEWNMDFICTKCESIFIPNPKASKDSEYLIKKEVW